MMNWSAGRIRVECHANPLVAVPRLAQKEGASNGAC